MWVFGYGSLLWNPGFTPVTIIPARLEGWRRSFCMLSVHYRGTASAPGLVLALDAAQGGLCEGLALEVAPSEEEAVLAYLRARELISDAYLEERLPVTLADGRQVTALSYVINRANPQYCDLSLAAQAALIAKAAGEKGPNCDYLYNTAAHLRAMGVADPVMEALVTRVRHLRGEALPEAR